MNHEIAPVWNKQSKILILGSFPSVKSREQEFFYGHPMNRFWKVLSLVLECELPITIEDKKNFLLKNHIAIWDVIASCRIKGSSDSSIQDVVPNDLKEILHKSNIQKIFVNGKTAEKLYNRYIYPKTNISAMVLPSTSPANAAYSLDRLVSCYQIIKKSLI